MDGDPHLHGFDVSFEVKLGAGRGSDDFRLITLGTGAKRIHQSTAGGPNTDCRVCGRVCWVVAGAGAQRHDRAHE